jgi:hypothetical protein
LGAGALPKLHVVCSCHLVAKYHIIFD